MEAFLILYLFFKKINSQSTCGTCPANSPYCGSSGVKSAIITGYDQYVKCCTTYAWSSVTISASMTNVGPYMFKNCLYVRGVSQECRNIIASII
jgi:hypothetical protein